MTYNPGWNSATGQVLINPTQGKKILIIGDSISVSGNKWVDFITGFGASATYNYSVNGAKVIDFGGATTNQQASDQVLAAISDGRTPDVIIINLSTNDLGSATSTVATARGKVLASLDRTKYIEALRWLFLKCQTQWTTAKVFFCTPIQRADLDIFSYTAMRADSISLAAYHNVIIIDQTSEAGFNMDFEVVSGAGRLLLDGIHPNSTGAPIQAKYIMYKVQDNMPQ